MRVTAILLAAALFAAPAFADKKEKKGPVFEPNTYRFGGTYSVLSSRSASQCSTTCGRDARCLSWSFVDLPGASGQNSCELKSTIGKSETNPTATSGISPRLEKRYQPSPYRDASTLLGAQTPSPSATTRRVQNSTVRKQAEVPALRTTTSTKRVALPKPAPKYVAAPAAPVTISSSPPKRIAAPAAPATMTASKPATRKAPTAPAVITSTPAKPSNLAAPPASLQAPEPAKPIKVVAPANPSVKPTPQVQFQPLKRSADGTYTPTPVKPAAATKPEKGRVVLTGPTGADVAKSVNGRVVLTGDMTGATGGGVGETPAAPIPRNAQGERAPYKDLSSREYPDYSVTRAAEEGGIEGIVGEAGS